MDDTQKGSGAKLPPIEMMPNHEGGWFHNFLNGYTLWGMIVVVSIGAIALKLWWLEAFIKSVCYD